MPISSFNKFQFFSVGGTFKSLPEDGGAPSTTDGATSGLKSIKITFMFTKTYNLTF